MLAALRINDLQSFHRSMIFNMHILEKLVVVLIGFIVSCVERSMGIIQATTYLALLNICVCSDNICINATKSAKVIQKVAKINRSVTEEGYCPTFQVTYNSLISNWLQCSYYGDNRLSVENPIYLSRLFMESEQFLFYCVIC